MAARPPGLSAPDRTIALAAVANIGGRELAATQANDVLRVHTDRRTKSMVLKKAALCLVWLFRTNPDCLVAEDFAPQLATLMGAKNLGVVTSVMSLTLSLVSRDPDGYKACRTVAVRCLSELALRRGCTADYMYYSTPSPWLQVKLLRLLQ